MADASADAAIRFSEAMVADADDAIRFSEAMVADADDVITFTDGQVADADDASAEVVMADVSADAAIRFSEVMVAEADDAPAEVEKRKTMNRLLLSARSGKWKTAMEIFEDKPDVKKEVTSEKQGIEILDAAVICGKWEYFNELLQVVDAQSLAMTYERFNMSMTILHRVARIDGRIKNAQALVQKCPSLTQIPNSYGLTPLHTAIYCNKDSDLIWYLASVTTNEEPGCPFTGSQAASLLHALTTVGRYDILHFILQRHHHLAEILLTSKTSEDSKGKLVLQALASQPSDFPSGTELGWLARFIYPLVYVDVDHFQPPRHMLQKLGGCFSRSTNHQLGMQQSKTSKAQAHYYRKFQSLVWNTMEKLVPGVRRIRDTKFKQECAIKLVEVACARTKWSRQFDRDPIFDHVISRTLKTAIIHGISEILSIYMKEFPLSSDDINRYNFLVAAIENRQDKVFNLFLRNFPESAVGIYKYDKKMNTLHIAAKLRCCPKITSIAGAAFQMQKELQWFEVIEKLVPSYAKRQINTAKMTPWQLFMEEHKTMRKEGEEWMKGTSNSCMLVATLIATVVFAAVFTVPGGNHEENGTPVFLQKNTFLVFAAFDAFALFSSINSLWMFLSILTARFSFEDFLHTLPKRLVLGLATLFCAIVSSITAFGAALSLVLGHRQNVVIVLIILMALISVAMFAFLQLPLFFGMIRSTYCSRLLVS